MRFLTPTKLAMLLLSALLPAPVSAQAPAAQPLPKVTVELNAADCVGTGILGPTCKKIVPKVGEITVNINDVTCIPGALGCVSTKIVPGVAEVHVTIPKATYESLTRHVQ